MGRENSHPTNLQQRSGARGRARAPLTFQTRSGAALHHPSLSFRPHISFLNLTLLPPPVRTLISHLWSGGVHCRYLVFSPPQPRPLRSCEAGRPQRAPGDRVGHMLAGTWDTCWLVLGRHVGWHLEDTIRK